MIRYSLACHRHLFVAGIAVLFAAASVSRAQTTSPESVEAALKRAKEYLYAKKDAAIYWEEIPKRDPKEAPYSTKGKQWGGLSAIAIYALLAAGENHEDPKLKPAVEWIKKQNLLGFYAIGLRSQIWTFLPATLDVKQAAIQDRVYLEKGIHFAPNPRKGEADSNGFYPYWIDDEPRKMRPGDGGFDLSVSQYGVLGMWACEQIDGVDGPPIDYWLLVDRAWKLAQFKDGAEAGAWAYNRGGPNGAWALPKATMTAAGVATLFITQDYILASQRFDSCRGGANNPWIDAGLAWMDKHVNELLGGDFYGMYGVERIGVASGKKYFGTINWYEVGADFLVKSQAADGSWGGNIQNTCFAMLFLTRGRAPVIMNKLEYSLNDPANKAIKLPWDQRPRDVANFATFAAHKSEQFFNWQVVNLKVPATELRDAPILYISGSLPVDFTSEEIAKLRDYCEAGGLILANADCGDPRFSQAFFGAQGLGHKLFPKYEFRELPANHPIYNDEVYLAKNWKIKPKVLGLSNGVRELVLVIPDADLGRSWQTRAEKTREENFQLGMDVFYYAAEKGNLRLRGDTNIVKADAAAQPAVSIKLARLMAGDNPDPEPEGWRRMTAIMLNVAKVGLTIEPVKLGDGKLVYGPAGYQVAHFTGTTKFRLSSSQQSELKNFVTAGGTLIVDAAGGSTPFADSAEQELATIFGGDPGAVGLVIAPDELPYTWTGFKISRVAYRQYAQVRLSGKLTIPRVRGIDFGGKTRVFYSREDLSSGLLGQPCDGIIGYEPASASAIMRNILLYAAYKGRAPRPTTLPASQPAPVGASK